MVRMVVSSEPLSEIKRGQIEMLAVTGGAPFLAARVQLQRAERQQREGNSLKTQRSEEHTSELQSRLHLVCRLLLEKKNSPDHRARPQTQVRRLARRPL